MAYKLFTGITALLIISGCTVSQMSPVENAKNESEPQLAVADTPKTLVVPGVDAEKSALVGAPFKGDYQPSNHYSLPLEVTNAIRYLPCDTIAQSTVDDAGDYDFVCSTDNEEHVSYVLSATEKGAVNQITLRWKDLLVGNRYDDEMSGNTLEFLSYIEKRFMGGSVNMAEMKQNIASQQPFRIPSDYFVVDYKYKIQDNDVEKYKLNTMTIYVR